VTAATATGGVEEPRPPAVEEARAGSGGAALAATASPRLEERRRDREEVLFRLPALIHHLYHPLYVLVSKILSSILNSPAPIHPLYHPLSTLFIVGPTCHFI
jgi:hypothetical protein